MKAIIIDQADGLRRLMALSTGRRVALVGSDHSAVAVVIQNLAAALLQEGKDVRVVDEHSPLQMPDVSGAGKMELIHAVMDVHGALTQRAARSDHILVVLKAHAASIKASYACIKGLNSAHTLERVRVLVDDAADIAEAQRILINLADVGRRYLSLAVEPAGWVRADPLVARSKRLNVTVVDAFGSSPAAHDYQQVARSLLQWPQRLLHHSQGVQLSDRATNLLQSGESAVH